MTEVTSENFQQEVMQSGIPVFIDLWAPWCAPCRMTTPIFETVSHDFENQVKFVKMDVDKSPEIAEKYNIQAVPTFLLISNGEEVGRKTGVISKSEMSSFAANALK